MATTAHSHPPLTRGDVLNAAEAAALLGCSKRHVYHLVDRGELPGARRLGHRVLVVRPVLEAWLLSYETVRSPRAPHPDAAKPASAAARDGTLG